MSISSVHNYKKIVAKKRGITFPNVHGKRPNKQGTVQSIVHTPGNESADDMTDVVQDLLNFVTITVGSTTVYVQKTAKSIFIHPDNIVVEF